MSASESRLTFFSPTSTSDDESTDCDDGYTTAELSKPFLEFRVVVFEHRRVVDKYLDLFAKRSVGGGNFSGRMRRLNEIGNLVSACSQRSETMEM